MTKLKIGLLASLGGLLMITALVAMILAVIYAISDLPWSVLCAIIAVLAAIGGRLLFWVTEYKM